MEQFNSNTYKKQTPFQEFYHSCLGKVIILAAIVCILMLIALLTVPTDSQMRWQMEDNIHECLQANDSIHGDMVDDYVQNIGHIITHADTTLTDKEMWDTYYKYNRLEIYPHTLFSTARIHNNLHPDGVLVGIGIFGIVIPTIKYADLLMITGNVRGKFNKRLIQDMAIPEEYVGENPNLKPYHYQGNPDD